MTNDPREHEPVAKTWCRWIPFLFVFCLVPRNAEGIEPFWKMQFRDGTCETTINGFAARQVRCPLSVLLVSHEDLYLNGASSFLGRDLSVRAVFVDSLGRSADRMSPPFPQLAVDARHRVSTRWVAAAVGEARESARWMGEYATDVLHCTDDVVVPADVVTYFRGEEVSSTFVQEPLPEALRDPVFPLKTAPTGELAVIQSCHAMYVLGVARREVLGRLVTSVPWQSNPEGGFVEFSNSGRVAIVTRVESYADPPEYRLAILSTTGERLSLEYDCLVNAETRIVHFSDEGKVLVFAAEPGVAWIYEEQAHGTFSASQLHIPRGAYLYNASEDGKSLAFGGGTWGLLSVSGSTVTVLWGREQRSGPLCVSPDGSLVTHFDTRTKEVEIVGRAGDDVARFRPGGAVQAALFLDGGRFLFLSSGRSKTTRDATGAVIAESCSGWAALYDVADKLAGPDRPEREIHE